MAAAVAARVAAELAVVEKAAAARERAAKAAARMEAAAVGAAATAAVAMATEDEVAVMAMAMAAAMAMAMAAVVMGVAAKGLAAAVREDPSTDKDPNQENSGLTMHYWSSRGSSDGQRHK